MKESIEEMRIRLVKELRLKEAQERQQHSLLKYEKTPIVAKEIAEDIKSALIKSIKGNPPSCHFMFERSFDPFTVDSDYLKQLIKYAFEYAFSYVTVTNIGHAQRSVIYVNFNFEPVDIELPKSEPLEPTLLSKEGFMDILGDEFKRDMVIRGCTFTNKEK